MIKAKRGSTTCVLAGLLGACSSHSAKPSPSADSHAGQASYQAMADDRMAHYELAMGSTSSGAALLDHPAPSYPAAMLASCPADVRLRALLIVGTDGRVDEVRVEDATGKVPSFVAAVRAAAQQWRFEPLLISHWAANANDEVHQVNSESKPFSLPYEFRFSCHAGSAQVSSLSAAHG